MNYAVELSNISMQYEGTSFLANDAVSLSIEKGSVLCLVGENGAGKSTLMNILYGLFKPTSGKIRINGKTVEFHSSSDAMEEKIGMVHQHFMLVEELSVLENIILGSEPEKGLYVDYSLAKEQITELMELNGMNVPLTKKVGKLPVGMQQKVEILKVLYRGADILILDEPTAVLTPQETDELFNNIVRLTKQGKTVIFITHKLNEVMRVSDYVAVMRRGKLVSEMKTEDTNPVSLAEEMVGMKLPDIQEREPVEGNQVISLDGISVRKSNGLKALDNVSLTLNQGEIVGIAGISGNGQQPLADVIAGITGVEEGHVYLESEDITGKTRKERIKLGISYIPADRKKEGLCMEWSLAQNAFAGYHTMDRFLKKMVGLKLINEKEVNGLAQEMIEKFDIRTEGIMKKVDKLSGGNQQKIVIARESIVSSPKMLIAAEPTRGVDIGAISFIHDYMIRMRNNKAAILLISSDLDEVFALSDRIVVLYEGKTVCNLITGNTTKEEVGLFMAGTKVQEDVKNAK